MNGNTEKTTEKNTAVSNINITKESIRRLLKQGKLEDALADANKYAVACNIASLNDDMTELQKEFSNHKASYKKAPFGAFAAKQANLSQKLDEILEALPYWDQKNAKGIPEKNLRRLFLTSLIVIKSLIIFRLYRNYNTGGFNFAEFNATAMLLFPVLAGYFTMAIKNSLSSQKKVDSTQVFSWFTMMICLATLVLYLILIVLQLEGKAKTNISFEEMTFRIMFIETILGGIIGIVSSRFLEK